MIAPDFRGRGMSDRDPEPARYLPTTYAADVLQLLDELAIDRAVFVGTSLGGLVTMLIAATQPQRIAATVLNDSGPNSPDLIERIRTTSASRCVAATVMRPPILLPRSAVWPVSTATTNWCARARRVAKEEGHAIVFDYEWRSPRRSIA